MNPILAMREVWRGGPLDRTRLSNCSFSVISKAQRLNATPRSNNQHRIHGHVIDRSLTNRTQTYSTYSKLRRWPMECLRRGPLRTPMALHNKASAAFPICCTRTGAARQAITIFPPGYSRVNVGLTGYSFTELYVSVSPASCPTIERHHTSTPT